MNHPQQKQQKQKKVLGSLGKVITTGVACFGVACTGPQVRPEPPAEPCPSGAVEAMESLGIHIGDHIDAAFLRDRKKMMRAVPVREGWTHVTLNGTWEELPPRTILKGRLLFGGERVYGRFTEAQNPKDSRTWPVCLELGYTSSERGLEMEPGSTAEVAKVWNVVEVTAVDRFQ